jgi:hypothetical protein
LPFWSSVSIPGKPAILLIDSSGNQEGWESDFCNRLFRSLQRSKLRVAGDAVFLVSGAGILPAELLRGQDSRDTHFPDPESFNVILLCAHSLQNVWSDLLKQSWLSQKIVALCSWQSYQPETSQAALQSLSAAAIVPESASNARESGLFYLKFLTELDLHSSDQISGKMIWFSFTKAKELLKRRRYQAKFGVRC